MELDPVYCINCKKAIAANVLVCPSCNQNQQERPKRLMETEAGAGAGARGAQEAAVAEAQLIGAMHRTQHEAYGDNRSFLGEVMSSWFGRRIVIGVIAAMIAVIGKATGCIPSRSSNDGPARQPVQRQLPNYSDSN
jgi:predicted amidophosphoribosyltransferase